MKSLVQNSTDINLPTEVIPSSKVIDEGDRNRLHFIGLGTGGYRILNQLYLRGVESRYTIIDSKKLKGTPRKFKFIKYGVSGTPIDSEKISKLNNWIPKRVTEIIKPNDITVLFAAVGHHTGTTLACKLSKYLSNQQIDFRIFCLTPFSFESENKLDVVSATIFKLKRYCKLEHINLNKIPECDRHTSLRLTIMRAYQEIYNRLIKHGYIIQ